MKKYKLIRIYPKSPELGTIIEFGKGWGETEDWIKDNPEEAKEFWELVEEKEFEILEFILNTTTFIKDNLKEIWYSKFSTHGEWVNGVVKGAIITKIRKLSDNVEFSIGDKIKWDWIDCGGNKYLTIKEFAFIENDFTDKVELKCNFKELNKFYPFLRYFEFTHYKEPLFTTFDGKDIFENETFWYVTKKGLNLWSKTCNSLSGSWAINADKIGDISFSTKKLAEEYRDNNKPIYSKNQILKAINKMQAADLDLAGRYIKQELNL